MIKKTLIQASVIIFLIAAIVGIGFVKYYIWRAEHPQAETWTFFIPNRR